MLSEVEWGHGDLLSTHDATTYFHGLSNLGERHVGVREPQGFRIGDEIRNPQPHRLLVAENPSEDRSYRLQIEQRFIYVENDAGFIYAAVSL